MTPEQCKMARAAVGWGVRELAEAAGVSTNTVARFEGSKKDKVAIYPRTLGSLQSALEAAGAEFIPAGQYQGDGGPGVRLRSGTAQPQLND